ncbi:MAG TPA: NAD-dependent epimerase/dehydratase family protein [Pyrinomonadaceae bacterium]|jgi:CDP-paratose 2-epimerase
MSIAIITGSAGLVGSEAASYFHEKGFEIVGIDNNLRKEFFGEDATTDERKRILSQSLKNYRHHDEDIRNDQFIESLFENYGNQIKLIVHTAAQPSHDWAVRSPKTDFSVNAVGTLNLLEAARRHCPETVFIYTSTNKVYGDAPNRLPLREREKRWEIDESHPFYENGVDETMSIDDTTHSLFGVSKTAGDLLVQEYGRYFGMNTAAFRGGCLTGSRHAGAELHGFLSYLVKCALTGKKYTIYGYKGKQVRDQVHSLDLVRAFWHFFENPRQGEVYNIGGSRQNHCSVLEAIELIDKIAGKTVDYRYEDKARIGDHIWWVSDIRKFQNHYPNWRLEFGLEDIIGDIIENSQWQQREPATSEPFEIK